MIFIKCTELKIHIKLIPYNTILQLSLLMLCSKKLTREVELLTKLRSLAIVLFTPMSLLCTIVTSIIMFSHE